MSSASSELVRTYSEETPVWTELGERQDGFANKVRLLWNREDGSVQLAVAGFEMPIDPAHALDAFRHPYPYLASELGTEGLQDFLGEAPQDIAA